MWSKLSLRKCLFFFAMLAKPQPFGGREMTENGVFYIYIYQLFLGILHFGRLGAEHGAAPQHLERINLVSGIRFMRNE